MEICKGRILITYLIPFQGKIIYLPVEVEEMLAACFRDMVRLGQGPTEKEMRNLVAEYIRENNVPTKFKDQYPGSDWAHKFMNRHKLKLKKGTSMQKTPTTVSTCSSGISDSLAPPQEPPNKVCPYS